MYEWLLYAYPRNMATPDQCKAAVEKNRITPEQYLEITGEEYVVAV